MYIDCSADTQALKAFSKIFLLSHALSYLQLKRVLARYFNRLPMVSEQVHWVLGSARGFEGFCKSVDWRKPSTDSCSHIDK